jgi:hypothetical protein
LIVCPNFNVKHNLLFFLPISFFSPDLEIALKQMSEQKKVATNCLCFSRIVSWSKTPIYKHSNVNSGRLQANILYCCNFIDNKQRNYLNYHGLETDNLFQITLGVDLRILKH